MSYIGFDCTKLALHSLRAGGATEAAMEGVSEQLFRCHGSWKSESAKDGYVEDSRKALLLVSESLKL